MPLPVKPCEGRFADELQTTLSQNRDRAQWANHRCETCGLEIGAIFEKGRWVPEQHWPTVKYHPRSEKKPAASRHHQEELAAETISQ